jgi:hypothetical protein
MVYERDLYLKTKKDEKATKDKNLSNGKILAEFHMLQIVSFIFLILSIEKE